MADPIADAGIHRDRGPVIGPSIYDYRQPARDWYRSRLDGVPWRQASRILDAGCGPGGYIAAARDCVGPDACIVGLDLNFQRASVAPADSSVVGDVQTLPFNDEAFDTVLAMHMLYHVPDIAAGLREFQRVLNGAGAFVASTNSATAQEELIELCLAAGVTDPTAFGDWRFCMENAHDLLEPVFAKVDLHVEESRLEVPDSGAVLTSMDSQRYLLEPVLAAGVSWQEFLLNVEAAADREIREHGIFSITCRTGIYVCS